MGDEVSKADVIGSLIAKVNDSPLGKILMPIVRDTAKDFFSKVSGELVKYLFEQKAKEALAPKPGAKGPGGKPGAGTDLTVNKLLQNPKIRKLVEEMLKDGGVG